MAVTVAALYVQPGGSYFGVAGVEPWDESRDARTYAGPHPVVAHPPCQRWGRFYAGSPRVIARTGERKSKGDDGGCFASALAAVRQFGGVLEHPADSAAWLAFGLNEPPFSGGWVNADFLGGWTCCVYQGLYGHPARKATWLYAHGVELPSLRWSWEARGHQFKAVESLGGGTDSPARIATPEPFRDLLLSIARSA